jgi:3-keto-disaccharide hydrolase
MNPGSLARSRQWWRAAGSAISGVVLLAPLAAGGAEPEKGKAERDGIAGAETLRWSFDGDPAGKAPGGWTFAQTNPSKAPVVWEVTADPASPSKPNVLSLTKSESTGGTFNLAIVEKAAFKDLDLSVKLRANGGKEDQGGGLIWRAKDERNYYICRLNPLESNFRLYKVVDGKRLQLATADAKAEAGKWYALRVVMHGDAMACFLDGKQLLEARDGDFKVRGKIGLWTKADAVSSFDDLAVRQADPITDADTKDQKGPEKKPPPGAGPDRKRPAETGGKK